MTGRFHAAARAELNAAAEYLDERRVGLGLDLIEEAERTARFAADFPQLGRPLDRRHRSIPFPRFSYLLLAGVVMLEVLVLAANGMRCPMTGVAARHTAERQDNFDIYLPLWIARYNKQIFGTLYVVGLVYAVAKWRSA